MSIAMFPDVTVNGVTIPSAAIAAEAQNHEAPQGKPGLAWRKAARALIVRELLLQDAARIGIAAEPRELREGQRETEDEARIRAVIDARIEIDDPTSEAVQALWAKDPDRFRSPPLWEVSHILCAADPGDAGAREKASARAQILAEAARKTPKGFAKLAAEHSDCGSKSNGGALGQLSPGDTVPEFEVVLRQLSEGEITAEPVASRFGYHVVRLDAVAEGSVLPFDAVAPKLKAAMEKAAWAKAVQNLTQTLVNDAQIEGIDLTAF